MRAGQVVPLFPKAVDTLLILLANQGRILGRDELVKLVWPDTTVEEGGLSRNISEVRKALGDGADDGQYIETIPRRGYRFIAPVREKATEPSRTNLSQRYGLAVLPLKMLSSDPAQEPFCEGMNEALITDLAKISALRVYQGTARGYSELADSGKVEAAVEGACLLTGRHVRITVRLVEARTGEHIWAQTYEDELQDIVELQGRVARDVARHVRVRVTPEEDQQLAAAQPVNPEAYQAYLEGRFWWNRRTEEGFRLAIESFELAIAKDPRDARAYAGLADTYSLIGSTPYSAPSPKDVFPKAAQLARKALELDSSLADAHASLAFVKLAFERDTAGAEREFQRAILLNPGYANAHHWYGHNLMAMGRLEEALAAKTRAQELDSRSLVIPSGIAWCHYYAGDYDRAILQCRNTLVRDPAFVLAICVLGLSYAQSGRTEEAIAAFQKPLSLAPENPAVLIGMSYSYARSGNVKEAHAQLAKLTARAAERFVPGTLFAIVYAGLQESDAAFHWLEKAREERSDYLNYVGIDPAFAGLRSDPRFASL